MVTTAIPEGEEQADWFFMDTHDAKWDGSTGIKLVAEWDGHGMIATQSHAFDFTDFPSTRMAWPGNLRVVSGVAGAFVSALFTAVVTGVTQSAFEAARTQVSRRRQPAPRAGQWARRKRGLTPRPGLRRHATRRRAKGSGAVLEALRQTAIAELAESLITISAGSSAAAASPSSHGAAFGRALSLRPLVLAYDQILDRTWDRLEAT
jgi:hypothetical protein